MRARGAARPAPAFTSLLRPAIASPPGRGGGSLAMLEMRETPAQDRAGLWGLNQNLLIASSTNCPKIAPALANAAA